MPEMTLGETQRALSDNRDRYFAQSRLTRAGARADLPVHGCYFKLEDYHKPRLAPLYKRAWWWLRSLM